MSNPRIILIGLVLLLAVLTANAQTNTAEAIGQAMAAELRQQQPQDSYASTGVLETREESGRRHEIPVRFKAVLENEGWTSVYEVYTFSDTNRVLERLEILHKAGQPNRYRLFRGAAQTRPEDLTGDRAMIPFAGTDFWLTDLGFEFFHWPEQRLVKKQMRRGRSCRVLESMHPNPPPGGYGRVLSWIDYETGAIILAEAYDSRNRLLKQFSVGGVKKVKGSWQLKSVEMTNVQADTFTKLKFDLTAPARESER